MITASCRVCGVRMHAPTLDDLVCGVACKALKERREKYVALGVQPGHIEYTPSNDTQRALHRKALTKRFKR